MVFLVDLKSFKNIWNNIEEFWLQLVVKKLLLGYDTIRKPIRLNSDVSSGSIVKPKII